MTKLKNTVQCMYAVVRFMPFAETREFANVGIVVIAPKLGLYDFKLAPKSFNRVTHFFDDLDGVVYKHAIESFEPELQRIRNHLVHNHVQGKDLVEYFKEITRTRESVLHFGEIGTMLTDNINIVVDKLYERLIGRNFTESKEYKEQQMLRVLKNKLTAKLPSGVRYTKQKIQAGMFEITVPLVTRINESYRIIKPLAFEQKNVLLAMEHGETWVGRLKKLIDSDVVQADKALVAFEKPTKRKQEFMNVYEDVVGAVKHLGAQAEEYDDTQSIIHFATADLSPESVENGFH
ncbi:DUF3037 domain-containing protein [Psychrosphaera sp. 1_MG-2023]|uniref:DUF3037 domain-containing protein n=1 Tax=Psychrosphaera sp. 1_MG-2023 TaxID=3062643 RepID=UPI0026E3F94A|nr:DUF3037 domain-containing protein [Psychrosphaera sp. 1_MG-2023]MDO6719864.1 DUF3037 domain-containing protein [Psychrosphaera sp. 1_MG-2023]